ncbi:M16 family metallopeptidase, partial [uncultured Muribaculum sp.]
MKSIINYILAIVMLSMTAFSIHAAKYEYRTVPNDPLKAKLYTLPNGLKIYMTVNKDQPRIQTYIAVRVGGKNDPAETTGLAHYFEHLMFKGTQNFGTSDYKAEEPLLDEIERLFEVYRKTTDEAERAALYHRIDSVSYEASKIAIPNEYDKLMAAIGASGTNAFTSYDVTCYTEDIPSNQIENWARIQADRFEHPVLRGFHTELETIYEEKNRSLTSDSRKAYEKMLSLLFPNHPYGTQTVLGTQEHLKNPSITNVKNYHSQWYVPNNMAICVSGDFDPDNMVDIITKYFGNLKPNPNLPVLKFKEEAPITTPIKGDVMGNESEMLFIGWPFPGAGSREVEVLDILSSILSNQGDAGLIDIDINQQHKALAAGAGMYNMADRTAFMLIGAPKEGQTLDEVRDLLLAEIDKLRKGEFDESLIEATINNYKRNVQSSIESNDNRVSMFLDSFVNGTDWADDVASIDRQSKLTKKDIVDFANKYLGDNNYAIVYKRQGKDTTELKMSKPALTPIVMNREMSSDFLKEIQSSNVKPIEPVFLDYNKDLTIFNTKKSNIPVLYKKNETNGLFDLTYVFEMGNRHNRLLGTAAQYLDLLGTKDMTAEQIKNELYRLGCTFYISPNTDRLYVRINGLSENMPQAVALVEKLMNEAVVDTEAYNGLVSRILKSR